MRPSAPNNQCCYESCRSPERKGHDLGVPLPGHAVPTLLFLWMMEVDLYGSAVTVVKFYLPI